MPDHSQSKHTILKKNLGLDEENYDGFVFDMILHPKSISDTQKALQIQNQEFTALHTIFGNKFFDFQRELMLHSSKTELPRKRSLYDLPEENYILSKMFGGESKSEIICSVLLPELLFNRRFSSYYPRNHNWNKRTE